MATATKTSLWPLAASLLLLLSSPLCRCEGGDELLAFDDAELLKLIRQEQFVIVLFVPEEGDARADDFEGELAAVREDLVDSLNAWVVKAVGSTLRQKYAGREHDGSAVVFFRKQVPVLYDGPASEEDILESVALFKEPCVRELNDNTFEHQTQAATGATTGDWFVLFVKDDCEECDLLRARWEALACRHKGRINVARVNRATTGAVTGRRFDVSEVPQAIFFRLGKMYRYSVEKYDVPSMTSFVTGWYKNVKAESIPLPKTPFDDLVQLCVDYIREFPLMVGMVVGVPVVLALAFFFLTRSSEKPKSKKKKKKAKDSSDKKAD